MTLQHAHTLVYKNHWTWCSHASIGPVRGKTWKIIVEVARNAPSEMPRISTVGDQFDRVPNVPITNQSNRFILVIDYFTKWREAFAIADDGAGTIAKILVEEWISRCGVMQHLHWDQGPELESKVLQAMCNVLGVEKKLNNTL